MNCNVSGLDFAVLACLIVRGGYGVFVNWIIKFVIFRENYLKIQDKLTYMTKGRTL